MSVNVVVFTSHFISISMELLQWLCQSFLFRFVAPPGLARVIDLISWILPSKVSMMFYMVASKLLHMSSKDSLRKS